MLLLECAKCSYTVDVEETEIISKRFTNAMVRSVSQKCHRCVYTSFAKLIPHWNNLFVCVLQFYQMCQGLLNHHQVRGRNYPGAKRGSTINATLYSSTKWTKVLESSTDSTVDSDCSILSLAN